MKELRTKQPSVVGENQTEHKKTSILKNQVENSENYVIRLPELKGKLTAAKEKTSEVNDEKVGNILISHKKSRKI